MPDYRAMYRKLLEAQEKAMDELKLLLCELEHAQKQTEEMYVNTAKPELVALKDGSGRASGDPRKE